MAEIAVELPSTPILILLAGILSHCLFSVYEPWPHQFFVPALVALGMTFYQRYVALAAGVLPALLSTASIASQIVAVLLASIAVYRLAFHRLRRFPGPKALALSKWAMLSDDMKGFRYRTVDRLHSTNGPIVRTGPRELSINDASIIPAIYGAQSACIKGPWYRGIAGDRPLHEQSLYDTRDRQVHAQRRKVWNGALSLNARLAHVRVVDVLVKRTISQLRRRRVGGDVDMAEWCDILTFDVMCEIGFSRSLKLIEQGKRSRELVHLQEAVASAQVIGNLPYLSKVLEWLPSNRIGLFKSWVANVIAERVDVIRGILPAAAPEEQGTSSMPPSPPLTPTAEEDAKTSFDVMGHLLHHEGGLGLHQRNQIIAEGMLLAVGGSDTTSAALTMALYLLTTHRDVADDVRAELVKVLGPNPEHSEGVHLADTLRDACPLLNAVIEETLRLYPPGLSGLQRQTPAEGLSVCVDGTPVWIPGHTVVTVPTWTIQRDPRHFSPAPNAFRPERWLKPEAEERMEASAAFMPFGNGPTGCAGREVAWVEMRMFLARMLGAFDLAFASDFNADAFEHGIRDLFTMHITVPLRLNLTERGRVPSVDM